MDNVGGNGAGAQQKEDASIEKSINFHNAEKFFVPEEAGGFCETEELKCF